MCPALLQVNAVKAAMEVVLARANLQKTAYLQYRDMVLFDRQLNLSSLGPAFKATCGLAAAIAATGGGAASAGKHSRLLVVLLHSRHCIQPSN